MKNKKLRDRIEVLEIQNKKLRDELDELATNPNSPRSAIIKYGIAFNKTIEKVIWEGDCTLKDKGMQFYNGIKPANHEKQA